MTSECQHEAWEFCPPESRRCADCGEWLEDQPLETAMTSELRPAVEVWDDAIAAWAADTIDTRQAAAAVIEADREAVRAEQAAEMAKWRDKYNELGQMALEQVSDLGTKLGRTETELDAAKADLQAANRELARFKALAETLAGALEPVERLEMWSSSAKDSDMVVTSMATVRKMREAYRQYKEARDER